MIKARPLAKGLKSMLGSFRKFLLIPATDNNTASEGKRGVFNTR